MQPRKNSAAADLPLTWRTLREQEIEPGLFRDFIRHQVVDLCLRRDAGGWAVRSCPFVDSWSQADYRFLCECLRRTVRTGGLVYAAFAAGRLKGFVSVESEFFGSEGQYLDLSALHVSEDLRRSGVGRALFLAAADWARRQGARKLYISSYSALESQAFYAAMGCVDAAETNRQHVEAEPFDRQLEYVL